MAETGMPKLAPAPTTGTRRLSDFVRRRKSEQADVDDAIADVKDAERARLDLLADELRPLFADIDDTDDRFELALSMGDRPRLWVDMVSHVAIGHDQRSYRFIKDTRTGRIVLAEMSDMERMADVVSDYVAERVLERERAIEGDAVAVRNASSHTAAEPVDRTLPERRPSRLFWFVLGILAAMAAFAAIFYALEPRAFMRTVAEASAAVQSLFGQ